MLDILLINPNYSKNTDTEEGVIAPLGICYISAYLKKNNIKAEVLDANALKLKNEEILSMVRQKEPLIIGITATTPSIIKAYELANEIKKNDKIKIVVGGPHVTNLSERTLNENANIDIVVRGEGEITTFNLINILKEKGNLSGIKGITYREGNKIVFNETREYIKDLDSLPEPDRSDLPINKYSPSIKWLKRMPFATMMTSRGCPNDCVFCASKTVFGRATRFRSPENVLAEIKNLISQFGIKEIMFYDDTFTLDKNRIDELCDLLIKNMIDITWGCLSRVDRIDENLLIKMKKAGCHLICYGIESGSERMLNIIRKNINLKQVEKAIELTKKVGIDCSASFVFGVPGETKETMQQTINFAVKINPLFAQFYRVVPLPGTELFNIYLKQQKNDNINWGNFLELGSAENLIKLDTISEKDFNYFLRMSYRKFYLRPKKIFQIFFKMLAPRKIKGLLKAGYLFFKLYFFKRKAAI